MTPLDTLERVPGRPPALRLPPGRHAMPGLAYGPYWRTHRVRPSEKTAFRVIPGLPPARPSCPRMVHPAEGRAPHARGKGIGSTRACPRGRPGPVRPYRENGIPGHTFGHTIRTHRVRPSEKTALPLISGFSPQALSPWPAPLEGRARHARIGRHRLDRGMCPVGQPASCLIIGWRRHASAFVGPRKADA